jgi:hypothetical protein
MNIQCLFNNSLTITNKILQHHFNPAIIPVWMLLAGIAASFSPLFASGMGYECHGHRPGLSAELASADFNSLAAGADKQ